MKIEEKKLKTKKVLVSVLIGVVSLLVLIIGATYAYFSVQVTNTLGTTTVRSQLESMGTVTISSTDNSELSMSITALEMQKGNSDITYYAQAGSNMAATTTETTPTIGNIIVSGNGTYRCNYTLTVSATSTGTSTYTAFQGMTGKSANQIQLIVNTEKQTVLDFNEANLFTNKTITGTFTRLTSENGASISAQLKLINKENVNQTSLAGTDISISIEPTSFECELVDTTIPANAVYLSQSTGTIYYSSMDSTTEYILNALLEANGYSGITYDMLNQGGNEFPNDVLTGDAYLYGDYVYSYNLYRESTNTTYPKWTVTNVIDTTKTSYGEILSEINGEPLLNMHSTFWNCVNMQTSPEIPETVVNMLLTFNNCTSLTVAPEIPNGVTNMDAAFYGCTSLETAPEIPNGVTNMESTFNGCTSLETAPTIPESVENMTYTFDDCTSLSGSPVVNGNPTNYYAAFRNTQITGISGTTTLKDELYATK